jgi:hypothetical protein
LTINTLTERLEHSLKMLKAVHQMYEQQQKVGDFKFFSLKMLKAVHQMYKQQQKVRIF